MQNSKRPPPNHPNAHKVNNPNIMKSTPLTTALTRLQTAEQEIVELANLKATTEATIADLAVNCSLKDAEAIAALVRGQSLLAILPLRQGAREDAAAAARSELLAACHAFIANELSPRCRAFADLARSRARQHLATAIDEPTALAEAVERSREVAAANALSFRITITDCPSDGPAGYAARLLACGAELDRLEASSQR